MQTHFLGIFLALAAAISWGSGDFSGGLAARKLNQFQVLLLMTLSSLFLVTLFTLIYNESLPTTRDILLSIIAGISGALGLAALYRGLATGNAALVAPTAGVIGAIFPMVAGIYFQGLPGLLQLLGFALAIIGIWFVTAGDNGTQTGAQSGLVSAILAGLGFGGFLTLIAQIEGQQVFFPLIFSKCAALILAIGLIKANNQTIPGLTSSPIALLSGLLDAGGNIFYLLATHYTRLDIVAVLASLYPALTVLLSNLILKEQISRFQWLGVAACTVAIVMITS